MAAAASESGVHVAVAIEALGPLARAGGGGACADWGVAHDEGGASREEWSPEEQGGRSRQPRVMRLEMRVLEPPRSLPTLGQRKKQHKGPPQLRKQHSRHDEPPVAARLPLASSPELIKSGVNSLLSARREQLVRIHVHVHLLITPHPPPPSLGDPSQQSLGDPSQPIPR